MVLKSWQVQEHIYVQVFGNNRNGFTFWLWDFFLLLNLVWPKDFQSLPTKN